MKLIHHSVLLFQEGTSDKIYEAELLEVSADQYIVSFRYGRRGSNLKQDSKTKQPVSLPEAEKIFKSLLVSKINKGYALIQGYDPFATPGTTQPVDVKKHDNQDYRQVLLQRLKDFIQAVPKSFDKDFQLAGHRLGRCLWQIGQLRLTESVPLVLELYQHWPAPKKVDKHLEILNYTLVWVMGRLSDPRCLPVLEEVALKLPANQQYLVEAARLLLWSESQRQDYFKLSQSQSISLDKLLKDFDSIADYAKFEAMHYHVMSKKELDYAQLVLEWRGVKTELLDALQTAELADTPDTFIQALPADLRTSVESDLLTYQPLMKAAYALKDDRLAELLDEMFEGQSKDQSLYEQVIAKLDLKGELNLNTYEENYVRQGWLAWLWQGAQTNLMRAIQKTGLIQNVRDFFDRMTQYQQYQHQRQTIKRLNAEDRSKHLAMLDQFGVKAQVLNALQTRHLYLITSWDFYQKQLEPEISSKIQGDLKVQVSCLLFDQQAKIKHDKLAQKARVLDAFEKQFLQRVYLSQFSEPARQDLVHLLEKMQLNADSFRFYRKLIKLAEFYDDDTLLVTLSHQIESTPSISGRRFSRKTRNYFRRRAMRLFEHLGTHQPERFVSLARSLMLQCPASQPLFEAQTITRSRYQESNSGNWRQVTQQTHYPAYGRHLSLSFLVRGNSRKCVYHSGKSAWIDKSPEYAESIRSEAFPAIWDQHPQTIFEILKDSEIAIILEFAFKAIQPQKAFCQNLSAADWSPLLNKSDLAIAQFALSYVTDSLDHPDVLLAAAHSPWLEIRQAVFGSLSALHLIGHPQVLAALFVSPYEDLKQKALSIWPFVHQQKAAVFAQILDYVIQHVEANLIQSFKDLVITYFAQEIRAEHILALLQTTNLDLQLLAIDLIGLSSATYQDLANCLPIIQAADDSRIHAGALAILGKLPQDELLLHQEALTLALLSHDSALRQQACLIIQKIQIPVFQEQVFQELVPHLFLKEPVEGFSHDLLSVIARFQPMAALLDKDLIWRLLMARSKLAQAAGGLLIQWRKANEFSIKQMARLAKHPVQSSRQWALASFELEADQVWLQLSDAITALDNPWQETRTAAVDWFLTRFKDREWPVSVAIALCDTVYSDVQAFGRDVLIPWLNLTPLDCLSKLSQHPDLETQRFVAGYLASHVAGQIDTILSLKPYFVTVLSRVNQGRSIKDLVIQFLSQQALAHPELAPMVTEILSEQSLSRIVNDKARYIQSLYDLQSKHPELTSPLQLVAPQRRSYGVSV